jgi:hypothetical protein
MSVDEKKLEAYKKSIVAKFDEKMMGKNARLLCCKLDGFSHTVYYDFAPYGSPLPKNPLIGSYTNMAGDEEQSQWFPKAGADRDGFELAKSLFKGLDNGQFQNNAKVIMFVDSNGNKI